MIFFDTYTFFEQKTCNCQHFLIFAEELTRICNNMTLPDDFQRQMSEQLGAEEYQAFILALQAEPPVSIRINPRKPIPAPSDKQVPWCKDGYYLSERPVFTLDPLFHAGCYYVQEASSMYLSEVLSKYASPLSPKHVLDLCAAPGGKSTLMLSCLPEETLVVCNEVIPGRAQILRENIIKWGYPNSVVTNNHPRDFQTLGFQFDLILCDAPCSGEGMFRKDEKSIQEWSLANVDMCQRRQRDIVADIWPCLRPDGILIYSTCTYNKKENEENVQWMAEELGADVLSTRRFMPHKTEGEGLFMAVLKKVNSESDVVSVKREKLRAKKVKGTTSNYKVPAHHALAIEHLHEHLHVLHYGIELATQKGKNHLQPSHSLAMSNDLNLKQFPTSDINLTTALNYLRGESIVLPNETPHGYVLLTYLSHPLGFVNNLGSRANNLYPTEWRIRQNITNLMQNATKRQ